MSVYVYERGGKRIEREFQIGQAPRSVRVKGLKFTRALPQIVHIGISDNVSRRPIDFVSTQLDHATYGKFHKGRVVKDEHGKPQLHFGSRDETDHLQRAWNASCESERLGRKLRRYGECDEFSDDVKRGRQLVNEDGTGNGSARARRKEFVAAKVHRAANAARSIWRARHTK